MVVKDDRWLAEAWASLEAQTLSSFEVVLLVDRDGAGLTTHLNRAARMAPLADYYARLDADDLAYPGRLMRQVCYLESHPEVAVCGTWANRVDHRGHLIGDYSPALSWLPRRNPLIHSSVMMRREAFEAVGGYDETLEVCQDYDLWLRLSKAYKLAILPEWLVALREHSGQVSRRAWARRWAQAMIRRRYGRATTRPTVRS